MKPVKGKQLFVEIDYILFRKRQKELEEEEKEKIKRHKEYEQDWNVSM